MSRTALLVDELARLAQEIRAGAGENHDERVNELMTRARLVGRSAGQADIERIGEALEALCEAVRARMEGIEKELREIGTRRAALSAYGGLRGHHSAQNLRTRV